MDFVAIDFETANSKRSSACSLGLVVVEENEIVDKRSWLIKPTPNYYDYFNTMIHGMDETTTANAPKFIEIWPEVSAYLNGKMVVAHNASFDNSVMRNTLDCFNEPYGEFDYSCTYRLAKAAWPNMGSYRLNALCDAKGIQFQHHDALEDARACALILFKIFEEHGLSEFDDAFKHFGFSVGNCFPDGYKPFRYKENRWTYAGSTAQAKRVSIDEINALDAICFDENFNGKHFVFTGTLKSMPRAKALELVSKSGGIAQSGVNKKTNFLVVGVQDYSKLKGEMQSGKSKKAMALAEAGQDIQVITEAEFIEMIDDELWKLFVG